MWMQALKLTFLSTVLVVLYFAAGLPVPAVLSAATCPLRGSCTMEPGLTNRTDILLFEDFEATNWASHWTNVNFATNFSQVSSPVFNGSRALQVSVASGQHDGGALDFDFTSAGVSEPEEMYLRYYLRFNDTWQRNVNDEVGKLPGFSGTYDSGAGQGCGRVNGTNGWSARMMNFDNGSTAQVGFYTYHVDMPDDCGEHMKWSPQLSRNRWYAIETRVKMNSVSSGRGNNDGILEGWIDGQLVFSKKNIRFRDTTALKIEKMWGNFYVGGSWTADRNMNMHLDNFVIARNPIGVMGGSSLPGAPGAPSNLRIVR
jgi:hypothetical protein